MNNTLPINLSILDFKQQEETTATRFTEVYKSIHIGF